ncbi:antibiotic biosynthesis monooxygenase family protein [Herbiconiux liukaitaii]|uniref:antibiotic biosynthesis monooxygenase family protein n=1 Tax=Herbiconiux liukaitaii TaxID=3342799 RepID=UPI0035BAC347
MIQMKDLDETAPFMKQLQSQEPGAVTIVNTFVFPEGQRDAVLEVWKKDSDVMKAAKGFISAQLYSAEGGAQVLTNVAVWESAQDLLKAFLSPDFQALLPTYPDGTIAYPTLMRKVAVENICVA